MGHISLNNNAYNNLKLEKRDKRDLNTITDDIIFELVTSNPKLINDTEKGLIPHEVLDNEIISYIDRNQIILESSENRKELIKKVRDYLFGYGPLQDLINNLYISDIRVIDENNTQIKVRGKRKGSNVKFPSKRSLLTFCYYVCIKNGGSLSELNAIQKLGDTDSNPNFILRINVCINPVNRKSPSIVIRKIPKKKLTLEDLLAAEMFDLNIYKYLKKSVRSKLNIIWCGKGGSGKTFLMNACLDYIPHDNSILVMQETEELHSEHPNCIFQAVKYKSGESDIEYTLRDLTINALLMDLDWMIIGEIKGAESMEFFNACYTGHTAWTSIHSDKAENALNKAVHLMKYSNTDLKREELLEMLSEVDLIIYMKNFKCYELVEIDGFDYERKQIIYNPVFRYSIEKENGRLKGSFEKLNDSCKKIKDKFIQAEYESKGGDLNRTFTICS